MAGVNSLSSFMSMLALNLHDYPDARRRIVADPGLMAPAIEESLRFNTSAQRFKRTVMRETDLTDKGSSVGDKVALAFGSGNRDWRKFRDPDVYDIERRPQGHLGFGIRQAFLSRQPDGAHGHRGRDEAIPRPRARISPHHAEAHLEFVLEFPQPRRTPLRNALESVEARHPHVHGATLRGTGLTPTNCLSRSIQAKAPGAHVLAECGPQGLGRYCRALSSDQP